MEKPEQLDAAQDAELDASTAWLDDEHYVLIEDEPSSHESERPKRYDDTQRIWCPPRD